MPDPIDNPHQPSEDKLESQLPDTDAGLDAQEDSKSARKRDAQRLRQLGTQLTALSAERLSKLNLPERLYQAVIDFQRFTSRGAKRRQLQLIGGILRKIDASGVEDALAELNGEATAARYELHQTEQWRDALLTDRDALTAYLAEHDNLDRQQLRNVVQKGQRTTKFGSDLASPQAKAAARALFRFLRDSNVQSDDTPLDDTAAD